VLEEGAEEGRQGRKGRRSGDFVEGCVGHMFFFRFHLSFWIMLSLSLAFIFIRI
jgi:hypothetical protein